MGIVIAIVFYLASLIAGGFMTASKHRAAPFVLALLLGWLGILVALFVPGRTPEEARQASEHAQSQSGTWKGTMG